MKIVKRVVATAVLSTAAAALPGSALASGDPYAGFGDPSAITATSARAVLAAAPLPGGRALVLAATTGGQHVEAFDTGDPRHAHQLAAGRGGTVVTWPDGRRLAVVLGTGSVQTIAAGPDGAWGAPAHLGDLPNGVGLIRAVALPDGRAAIAWTTSPSSPKSHLFAVATDAAGRPSTEPTDYGTVSTFRLAAGPDGTAAVGFSSISGLTAPTAPPSVAILKRGAGFGAPIPVPGGAGSVPPIAIAADGSAVLIAASDTRIARISTADGSALPDLPPLTGSTNHDPPAALDVASDGAIAFDTANPLDGWTLGGVLADGTQLPALPGPATSPEYQFDTSLHAWPGGAAVTLTTGAVGDSSIPYSGVLIRDPDGTAAATVLAAGPDLAGFPGTAPASFDAYTISGGRLWRISRPGAPSRTAATLTLTTYAGQIRATQRVIGFHVGASQVGTVTAAARVRRGAHGRWQTVRPTNVNPTTPLLPFTDTYMTFPLTQPGSVCRGNVPWTVVATARFVNRAGVRATSRTTYRRSCQVRRG
jgi:hypothetical protein